MKGNHNEGDLRSAYAYREAIVSILGNILIAILKISVGTAVSSVSIVADGVHSISDVGSSLVVIAGARASEKEADEEHPFGHGRYEYIASLIIYVLLILVAVEIFMESVQRLRYGSVPDYGENLLVVYIVLLVSMVAKELMARYSFSLGNLSGNTMLHGDAWHHRSDALTTAGVIVGVFLVSMGFPWADALISMLISLFIGYTAFRMAMDAAAILAGKNAEPEELEHIRSAALSVEGVLGVHSIYVHDYGRYRSTTLHIEVPEKMSAEGAHEIADEVENRISDSTGGDVTVHMDPVRDARGYEASRKLKDILNSMEEIQDYHNIRYYFDGRRGVVSAHIVMKRKTDLETVHDIIHRVEDELAREFPEYRVEIHPEPEQK